MLVLTAEGTATLMGFLARGIQLAPWAGLFVNNVVPDDSFTLANLVEASFPGYNRQYAGPPLAESAIPGGATRLTWNNVLFSGRVGLPDQSCFGYFFVQDDWTLTPRLLWAERMSPVVTMPAPTALLQLQPVFDFSTLFDG